MTEKEKQEAGQTSTSDGGQETETATTKSCPAPTVCCNRFRLDSDDATGFLCNVIGSNTAVMSNVFLATALILLAKREAGCDSDGDNEDGVEVQVECGKVYGMKPSSLITVIATVSGLLTAFLLPFIGAIVDYTPKRWECGAYAAALFCVIQAIQIGTVPQTWFVMAILQAFNGFLHQVNDVCLFAYLPEIGIVTEEKQFTWYNTLFTIFGTVHQFFFLVAVVGMGMALSLDDQRIGQLSQGIDVFVSGGYYYLAYYFFNRRGPRNTLKEGDHLFTAGFKQVFRTTKQIFQHYPRSIGLYFLAMAFTEAAVDAFSTISVTFMNELLGFDATQIGFMYLVVMVFTVPGAYIAYWLATKTSPLTAIKVNMSTFIGVNFGAFLWLQPGMVVQAYICAALWGFWIGMYYPLNKLVYSLIVPKGQEAELSGFWRYCSRILVWAPPLVFTVMNESGIPLGWGGISLNIFVFVGVVLFMLMQSWDDCLKAAEVNRMKETSGHGVDEGVRADVFTDVA